MAESGNGYDRYPHLSGVSGSVVQVETLGRAGMLVMLVMFVVIVIIGVLAGYALGASDERDESVDTQLRQMNARVSVLEYDAARVRAQLIEKGLINDSHE